MSNKKSPFEDLKNFKKSPGGKGPKKNYTPFVVVFLFALLLAVMAQYVHTWVREVREDVTLSELTQNYTEGLYSTILIDDNKAIATLSGWTVIENWQEIQQVHKAILPERDSLADLWLKNPDITTTIEVKDLSSMRFWSSILPTLIFVIIIIALWLFFISRMGGMANSAMTFGKSRARLYDPSKEKILFKDVAWAEEEKEELQEMVDFLKNPKKYREIGAKIPKGTLMVGPPGTGKTMLARAVAGESNVPFLSISGSEFVEMFVWVGASRVRDLFTQAKKLAPAIIFIDEIDAIGKKRWPGMGGWHDEREQTLNQILTEMDGFDNDTNVIIIGATNRSDVLDKALLRPWRFDRKITVNLPNQADREKILQVHARDKKIEKDVDFKALASSTVGFSWADLWNILNEAAIISARFNKKVISQEHIQQAFERIVMGLQKKSLVMNEEERKITAYHEIGHALIGKLCKYSDPVHKVSITPRGWALWVTWFMPERDAVLTSKAKFLDELCVLYGWRASEEIFFGKEMITTGASNDIERATKIARNMVMRYGMYDEIGQENFLWERGMGNYTGIEGEKAYISENTQKSIDAKVREILREQYERALKLIKDNKKLHVQLSEDLLKMEEMTREQFEAYFA